MQIQSVYGKYCSACIFTSSGLLPISEIFIKVIRGLPAVEVLNFQSSGFLTALQYTESASHLQVLPGIEVWIWY